ncbi:hypothetical protein Tco_0445300 [Tanacetum coccineum]
MMSMRSCELISDNDDVYDDPFDSKEDKINESKTLSDELDSPLDQPSLYELPFHKEIPGFETLLSFSSENEEKVFNPGILTSKGVQLFHVFPELFIGALKLSEVPLKF